MKWLGDRSCSKKYPWGRKNQQQRGEEQTEPEVAGSWIAGIQWAPFPSLPSFVYLGNFPNENGKGASWAVSRLSSPIFCEAQLMIKPSQERGTAQYFPSLKSNQESLTKGHVEPSGKNRKLWLCGGSLCVFKWGAWKTGAGGLCSETRPPARGVMFDTGQEGVCLCFPEFGITLYNGGVWWWGFWVFKGGVVPVSFRASGIRKREDNPKGMVWGPPFARAVSLWRLFGVWELMSSSVRLFVLL